MKLTQEQRDTLNTARFALIRASDDLLRIARRDRDVVYTEFEKLGDIIGDAMHKVGFVSCRCPA